MRITELRCELSAADAEAFADSPYCIDRERPCFSFALDGEGEDVTVRYYKILVSSSASLLADNNGDMWDSGLIYSSDTSCIEYGGRPLSDMTTYYFRAFAMVGRTALKSRIGIFHVGIIHDSLWRCGFIGSPDKSREKLYFTKDINVIKPLRHAYAYAAATGPYVLSVNGKPVKHSEPGTGYVSFRYGFTDLTANLAEGSNLIAAAVEKSPDMRTGFILHLDVEYEDGSASTVVTDGEWRVMTAENADDGTFAEGFCPPALAGAKPKAAPRPGDDPCGICAPESFYLCRDISLSSYCAASVSDLFALQRPDGSLPAGRSFDGGIAEQGASVLAFSYKHYMTFGDVRVLKDNYNGMQRLYVHIRNISYISAHASNCRPYPDPLETAYFAVCAVYMKRISEALGLGGEAEYYKKETDFIVDLLGESLMSKDAPDGPRDCACYALCAAYGLCGVSDEFVTLIQNSGADAVGSPSALYHVMSALCAAGRSDDAYRLLEKFAGHNDAYSPYCYEWMASYSAGINPAEPGYRKISVTPG